MTQHSSLAQLPPHISDTMLVDLCVLVQIFFCLKPNTKERAHRSQQRKNFCTSCGAEAELDIRN